MKAYRKFALLTVAATYFLIFVGGLVRVSGAGLGCPDWPRCFGRWWPPTSIDQLPPGIDPATFNVTLAWIEYVNRLVGMTVGFLILGVAILAIRHYRREPRVLIPSLLSAVLVAIQGWQGSQVISSELEPYIVTIHMVLALVIVSLLIYAILESYATSDSRQTVFDIPRHSRLLVIGLWCVTLVQIISGSQVRQSLEHSAAAHPDWTGEQLFSVVGAVNDLHLILGLLVAALTIFTGMTLLKSEAVKSPTVVRTVWSLIWLVVIQAVSGVVLMASGLPALTDLFHLWMAALYLGLLLVLLVVAGRRGGAILLWESGYRRTLTMVAAAVVVLLVVAYLVITQAEASRQAALLSEPCLAEFSAGMIV